MCLTSQNLDQIEFPACGTPEEVLKYHKLDHISLASQIKRKIKNK